MIQLDDKSLWKRHVDHIQHRVTTEVPSNLAQTDSSQSNDSEFPFIPFTLSAPSVKQLPPPAQHHDVDTPSQLSVPRRNPLRTRHPPKRFKT